MLGSIVRYNGKKIIVNNFVWDSLYNNITIWKEYKILGIVERYGKLFYRILGDKEGYFLWLPEEVFCTNEKIFISRKYDLR